MAWFESKLQKATERYRFVCIHHPAGGNAGDVLNTEYGRGGARAWNTGEQLRIHGLMCIPPVEEEPAVHFAFLAKMARELGLANLSMGMSGDFETAIEFGATHIRVGSSIFGTR